MKFALDECKFFLASSHPSTSRPVICQLGRYTPLCQSVVCSVLCIKAQTRRVYEKKLIRLLRGDESMTHDYSDDYEDEEEEEDDEDMDGDVLLLFMFPPPSVFVIN